MILNFLRLGTLLPIRYILYESNSRKSATFAAAKFSFLKNHRDHKNEKNLNLPTPSFYSREQLPKIKLEIQFGVIFFLAPKWILSMMKAKTIFFSFPSDFAF